MAAETGTSSAARGRGESVTRRMFRLAWEMTTFKIGLGVFIVLVGAAIIWPELSPYDPMKISVRERFLPPIFLEGGTWAHIAGTDQLGRDLFVRSLVGLRNGLGIAAAAVAIMFVVGCALGVISGYWGRWVDQLKREKGQWRFARREVVGIGGVGTQDDDVSRFPGHPGRLLREAAE